MVRSVVGICICRADSAVHVKYALNSVVPYLRGGNRLAIYLDGVDSKDFFLSQDFLGVDDAHIIQSYENKGLACGINELLRWGHEQGAKYFFRMDADDISLPRRFTEQLAFMESNPTVDLCGSNIIEFEGDEGWSEGRKIGERRVPCSSGAIVSGLVRTSTMNHPSVCFRYASLKNHFPSFEVYSTNAGLAEDYQLWLDLAAKGFQFANLPEPLLAFRVSKDFYRRRSKPKAFAEHRVRLKAIDRLGDKKWLNKVYAYLVLAVRLSPKWLVKLAYWIKRRLRW